MATFYLVIIFLLTALAIIDLVVGVSNDAVNFLNSAIGSKVTTWKNILFVAALGVLVGATFSNGIMEVARKGIFNPGEFYFNEIMIIFLAVMLTDIILLDLFNTFGMPTSTTVSIVFELLGAAVTISFIKMSNAGEPFAEIGTYINASRAILIISGIFLSVGIAFVVGAITQWLSRMLFTFHLDKRMKYVGGIWGGLAVATLSLFLVFKGLKGASFVSEDFLKYIKENTWMLFGISFVAWTIILQILYSVFKVNILKVIVLLGTFSLAMAFAGNDLVNFIGVPLAGLESYSAWIASGEAHDTFRMTILNEKVHTNTFLLLGAGVIMVLALAFSKKARYVTETEVNLGRDSEGDERFSSNWLSREVVWASRKLASGFNSVIPNSISQKMNDNFSKPEDDLDHKDRPAFDMVRASVNLVTASMLIAFATSLKLPLSTTYVSFMVAMGSSLTDKAWGRDSAVYRIAGVLNVIGGWFLTAIIAFTVSATFAVIIFYFKGIGIAILVALAVFLIIRTMLIHRKQLKAKEEAEKLTFNISQAETEKAINKITVDVSESINIAADLLRNSLKGLKEEDRSLLGESKQEAKSLRKSNQKIKGDLVYLMPKIFEKETEISRYYLLIYDMEQDLLQSIGFMIKFVDDHVKNSLTLPTTERLNEIMAVVNRTADFMENISKHVKEDRKYDQGGKLNDRKVQLLMDIEEMISHQIEEIKARKVSRKSSKIVFDILLELKDITAITHRFYKLSFKALNLDNRGGYYIKKKK